MQLNAAAIVSRSVAIAIFAIALACTSAPENAVSKTSLPADLGAVIVPADNPQTLGKVALGHQLFFDKRLSVDGSRACYSCHTNEDGNGGKDPLAIGPGEKVLTRHSPVIWNVGFLSELYWDGRSKSLEDQATAALAGGNMGVGKENLEKKAAEIAAIAGYKEQFDAAFPGEGVTATTIVKALSAYERTLICDKTAYDKHAKGDESALTAEQKKGLDLYMGKAACVVCHAPPHFSTAYGGAQGTYYNVGVGTKDKKDEEVDIGRAKLSGQEADWAAFKVPSLRNVSKSAPYFHDGSVATLEAAVRLMASGGVPNKALSPLLVDRKLSDDEVKQLVAFLGALDCDQGLIEPKLP
jgi:cytochrome c peroxidase